MAVADALIDAVIYATAGGVVVNDYAELRIHRIYLPSPPRPGKPLFSREVLREGGAARSLPTLKARLLKGEKWTGGRSSRR